MRKYFKSVSKFQKSFKLGNSQLFELYRVWCKVSKFQSLYKNIKSYYYYIIYEIIGENWAPRKKRNFETFVPNPRPAYISAVSLAETFLKLETNHRAVPGKNIGL